MNDCIIKEERVIEGILHAMSITEKDVSDDFKNSISRTNKNGLHSNVWARRSDVLENQFKEFAQIEVLHIERSKLWQIDPVFNKETGDLYLLFSDTNLSQVRRKFIKRGHSTHYSASLLLKNDSLIPLKDEQLELIPLGESEIEKQNSNKQKDIEEMLGENSQNVKTVIMVSVNYFKGEAIAASLKKYTNNFELSFEKDISDMLVTSYSGDNSMNDEGTKEFEEEKTLVSLKETKKQIKKE